MSQYFEVIGASSPGKDLAEVEKDEEVEVMAIDMSRHAIKMLFHYGILISF